MTSAPDNQAAEDGRHINGAGGDPPVAAPETVEPAEAAEASSEEQRVEEDLDALLAEVEGQRDEYLDLAQRTRADFENFRKRAARETVEAERRGRINLARKLVPSLDNLERALAMADDDVLLEGVRLVLRQLHETLGEAGIVAYDPTGEVFDPTWHEALSTVPSDEVASGHVVETLARGYRLDDQVIRAAQVVVSG